MSILIILGIALIMQAVGFVWYGPLLGKPWMRVMGVDPAVMMAMPRAEKMAMQKKMVWHYVLTFVLNVLTLILLGAMVNVFGSPLLTGAIMWLGFAVPVLGSNAIWSGKGKKLAWTMFGINAGYFLVMFALGSFLLSLWA